MAFKRGFSAALLLLVVLFQIGVAQDRTVGRRPEAADPFSLTRGRSFSASGNRDAMRSPAASRAAISTDLDEALAIIKNNHVSGDRLDTAGLTEAAITSMLHMLDPHSRFYNASEFQDLLDEHESEYSGTGSSIAAFERNGVIDTYVVSTFPDSPAARSGVRFGDKIVAVNGRRISGESPDTVRDLVRGRRGTIVSLTIQRAESDLLQTIQIRRDMVHEPAVPKGFLLRGNTGYVDLTGGFSNATFNELESVINDLKARGMTSLVLDLRGNGGGILDQAIKVAEKFLPPGTTIVSQRGRSADDARVWKASKVRYESMPLVLIVNENTASASEVLAGALQDNDRALIIGHRTFGKGLVQSVLNLPEGAGLTLTAARYYTPTGRSIQRDYKSVGLYNYYNHRIAEIDEPSFAARTPTDRIVYGGDGIAPDETTSGSDLTPERLKLLDPIFFFSLDLITHRTSEMPLSAAANAVQKFQNRSVFGDLAIDGTLLRSFDEFLAKSSSWDRLRAGAQKENAFVRQMLGYYIALGISGSEAGNRARIEADPQVSRAVELMPRSAQLYAAARKAGTKVRKEKGSPSLVLSEQR